ncbi:hypothetical protein AAVH_25499 [Aphelenchoides avenae]|nr:hypothetical protein AAVH_25499 [Aphelenchus avenae]
MISEQALQEVVDAEDSMTEAELMKLYRTPPKFEPPKFTVAFYGIIGAERPAKHTEQESFLFVLRTPSNHLTLIPLAQISPEEVALGILRPEGDCTLSVPMHLCATQMDRRDNELVLAQYQAVGRHQVGTAWTRAYAPFDRELFRSSSIYKLASGLNEIGNNITVGSAWTSLLFNIAEAYNNNYASVRMGKGFTTPLYCETGRYASGHTGEEYWSSERQEDNRMHLVGKTVAELQKLVAQLNFNQDLQNNAVEHMVVRPDPLYQHYRLN